MSLNIVFDHKWGIYRKEGLIPWVPNTIRGSLSELGVKKVKQGSEIENIPNIAIPNYSLDPKEQKSQSH